MSEEKTLGQVAWEAYSGTLCRNFEESWLAVADAVVAAHEARRWRAIEEAPNGCVTEDAGCRGESEWFIGKLKNGDIRKVKRLPHNFGHTWCDMDQTYYTEDWLVAWTPIPAPQKEVEHAK